MTQLSNMRVAQAGFGDRHDPRRPEKYHPRCGEEHRHKPTKALIGIGLLIVLSFVLYGITGHANEPATSNVPSHSITDSR